MQITDLEEVRETLHNVQRPAILPDVCLPLPFFLFTVLKRWVDLARIPKLARERFNAVLRLRELIEHGFFEILVDTM